MLTDINQFNSSCSDCAQAKVPWAPPVGKLMLLPMPQHPWSLLAIDFITNVPKTQSYITIMVITDWFAKYLMLIPLPGLSTDLETTELIFTQVFCYFVISEDIVSDWGPQFTSILWSKFMDKLGV